MFSMLLVVATAEAKKPKAPVAPPLGWHREEGWKGDCYYPPVFDTLGQGERQLARQTTLEGMMAQWGGKREDGVTIDSNLMEELEIVLLGRPVLIEQVGTANRDMCVTFMKGGELGPWQSYLSGLPAKLTAGECMQPLTYTMFDYLDIGRGWQRPIGMCKGDKAHIVATAADKYRINDKAPWINVQGDATQKAVDATYPCNIEGCFVGMLVGKFTTEAGIETIFPIGTEHTFVAPEHGTLSYSINDIEWYDNKWFKSATIEDKTAITIEPGQ